MPICGSSDLLKPGNLNCLVKGLSKKESATRKRSANFNVAFEQRCSQKLIFFLGLESLVLQATHIGEVFPGPPRALGCS